LSVEWGRRIFFSLVLALWTAGSAVGSGFIQLRGVVHVHSHFSSGEYSIDQLAEKAKASGLDVVVVTDHDRVVMEYGVFPFRNLLKRRVERKSVLRNGPETYLAAIRRVNNAQSDVIVIPGVQSSPFYYWSGSALQGNLTAHDYRKELLLIGLDEEHEYRSIPLLHGGFSTQHVQTLLPRSLVFAACGLLGLVLCLRKGRMRFVGGTVFLVALLLLINHHPFQSSRFDPYHGDQGIAPYQDAIDYTVQRGGLVFWAHPESTFSRDGQKLGPITLQTRPYLQDLVHSTNYTGFSVLYGDRTTAADPGGHWDRLLEASCRGERSRPVWGIAGSDFHQETQWLKLDTLQTVFLVEEKTTSGVLEALAAGRVYAVLKTGSAGLVLEDFVARRPVSGASATLGQTLRTEGEVVISGRLEAENTERLPIQATLVRDGEPWQQFSGGTPLDFRFEDADVQAAKSYYRLAVDAGRHGRLLSNPIFVVNPQKRGSLPKP